MRYFVTGIDTEIGKTVVSAVLTEALRADYWKPIQAGDLDYGDAEKVRDWLSNGRSHIHPSRYRLNTPASPHYAAELDGIHMELDDFKLPRTDNSLIVEGAGGLLVPINRDETILDLIIHLGLPVVLVSKNYLGSINHTLSSIAILKNRGVPIHALVFNGSPNAATEDIVLSMSGVQRVVRVPLLSEVDKAGVLAAADGVGEWWV